jgi:hypothetical protein
MSQYFNRKIGKSKVNLIMTEFSEKDKRMISELHNDLINSVCEFHVNLGNEICQKLKLDQDEKTLREVRFTMYLSIMGSMVAHFSLSTPLEKGKNHSIDILREVYDSALETINHKYEREDNEKNYD